MPLPKPNTGETRTAFVARCMANDTMAEEYGDREKRAAVCFTQWRDVRGKSMLRTLERDAIYHFESAPHEVTAKAATAVDDPGWIEGYANQYNVLDKQREIIRPGTFAQSIRERVPAGKVKLMVRHYAHGGDVADLIGIITAAKEDDYGLWIHAELSATPVAQDARQKVLEGLINAMSLGAEVLSRNQLDWEDGEPAWEITSAKLYEVTLTLLPANEGSVITAAKAVSSAGSSDDAPVANAEEAENTRSQAAGWLALRREIEGLRRTFELLTADID